MAPAFDGIEVGRQPGQRDRGAYSFRDDLEAGEEMRKAGRLSEVWRSWAKWWDDTRKQEVVH